MAAALVAAILTGVLMSGSGAHAQATQPPAAPTGLTALAITHDSVSLAWNDPGDDTITHYKVVRRNPAIHQTKHFPTIEDNTGTSDALYTDNTPEAETTYRYRVIAVNSDGESPWSRYVIATTTAAPAATPIPDPTPVPDPTPAPTSVQDPVIIPDTDPEPPAAPTGLSARAIDVPSVILSWANPNNASVDGYRILRRERDGKKYGDNKGDPSFSNIVSNTISSATSYTDTSVAAETRYEYKIRARAGNLMSPRSAAVQPRPQLRATTSASEAHTITSAASQSTGPPYPESSGELLPTSTASPARPPK